ncbi:MAG: hypothetical protein LBJ70_00560 [Holosporales bacterium]|jgi:cell division transport system permease protein|nr:hypothetical protein [Holosporales bacterium]
MKVLRRDPSDFPFRKNLSSKVLPWVIGALIYLATLAVLGCQGVYRTTESWNLSLSSYLTVEIPTTSSEKEQTLAQLPTLLEALEKIPGVRYAKQIPEDQVQELVAGWIENDTLLSSLDLPVLVDVRIIPGQSVSFAHAQQTAAEVFKKAQLHDHADWYSSALRSAFFFQFFSVALALLTSIIVIGTIIFSTHTHLIVYQHITNVLQLIGATDAYIAWQLEKYMAHIATKAALFATLLSALTLHSFQFFCEGVEPADVYGWLIVVCIPMIMIAVVICVARLTVLWSLHKKDLNIAL